MRKIFDIAFLCICLFLVDISAGSWVHGTQLPADIYLKAGFKLKNREVIKVQQYLFTRVNFKSKSKSFTSLDESNKAGLLITDEPVQHRRDISDLDGDNAGPLAKPHSLDKG